MPTKKSLKIFEYDFKYLNIVMIIVSFVAFVVEDAFRLITTGIIDSRFQRFPFIYGYGIAVLVLYVVLGTPRNMRFFNIKLFQKEQGQKKFSHICYLLVLFAGVLIVEVVFGHIIELFTGGSMWNFSYLPLHIGKYSSLPTVIGYGLGIYLLMNYGFTPLMDLLQSKMNEKAAIWIDCTLGVLLLADFIVTAILLFMGRADMVWIIYLPWHK